MLERIKRQMNLKNNIKKIQIRENKKAILFFYLCGLT